MATQPQFTGRNERQELLLNACRASSTARKYPPAAGANIFEEDVLARQPIALASIADFGLRMRVRAARAWLNYYEAGGSRRLDYRFNRDAQVLLADKNLSDFMHRAVWEKCQSPLLCRIRRRGQSALLPPLKAPINFSRKPVSPKHIQTIEFTVVPFDEDEIVE